MIKKNYGVLNFLLKYNAPILHPPHYAGKKLRKCLGEAHESAQTWEKPFFHIRPLSGMRKGGNESVMALTGFHLLDIIARVPSDKVFVN